MRNGPFNEREWRLTPDGVRQTGAPCLRRSLSGAVPTQANIAAMMRMPPTPLSAFRNFFRVFDRYHGTVHVRIGGRSGRTPGTMSVIATAANAPEFFLHHGNIDRLWGIYQDQSARHKRASSNFNAPISGTGYDFEALHKLEDHANNVCVIYAAPTARPRRRLSRRDTSLDNEGMGTNGMADILYSLDYSFFAPDGPFWKIPSRFVLDPADAAQWELQRHNDSNVTIEDIIENIKSDLYYMINQPKLEVDHSANDDVTDEGRSSLIKRAAELSLGISVDGLKDALKAFDETVLETFNAEYDNFAQDGCFFQGNFYADMEEIDSTVLCPLGGSTTCSCRANEVVCNPCVSLSESETTTTSTAGQLTVAEGGGPTGSSSTASKSGFNAGQIAGLVVGLVVVLSIVVVVVVYKLRNSQEGGNKNEQRVDGLDNPAYAENPAMQNSMYPEKPEGGSEPWVPYATPVLAEHIPDYSHIDNHAGC